MPRCKCDLNLGWSALECPGHQLPTEVVAVGRKGYRWILARIPKPTFALAISAWGQERIYNGRIGGEARLIQRQIPFLQGD